MDAALWCTGRCHFRQKGSDKNHTGLSPLGISASCGFVFTSNQVCPKDSMIIGSRFGTYSSRRISVYLCIFGTYSSARWFITYYTNGPYQEIIALCIISVDSSTWYSSYTIHVGISFPTVATHMLCLPYSSYVLSMVISTNPTLSWPIIASYTYQSLIPSSKPTENIIHLTFSPWHHIPMMSNDIACWSISSLHPMMALSSRYPSATSSSSPHHRFKSSSRGPSGFLTKFYWKMLKIWASRLAFSPG